MATILVSSPLAGDAVQGLRQRGHEVVQGEPAEGLGHDGLIAELERHPGTEAMICLLTDRIDEQVLAAGRSLRAVANCAVGIDNLDLQALRARGVVATNTPGVLTDATADLAFALILDACRNVTLGDRMVRAGQWRGWAPTLLLGPRVSGSVLGIVGFGRIGQAVARRARGFGMRVLYSSPRRASPELERELGASFVSLDELIGSSEILTLHCPLTPATRGLLSRERMLSMRKGAVVVNTARGACVDEAALVELLRSGHLAAAGLDVYDREPHVSDALKSLPNVVLAPHLGSADRPTRERMAQMCIDSVLAVLEGRTPEHVVT